MSKLILNRDINSSQASTSWRIFNSPVKYSRWYTCTLHIEHRCGTCVVTEDNAQTELLHLVYITSLAHPVTHIGQEDISGGLTVYGMLCVERGTIHPLPGNGGGGVTRHSAGQRERLSLIDCCYIDWLSDHSRRYCVCVCAHVHVYCTSMTFCANVYFLMYMYTHVDLTPHLPQLDLFRSEPSKQQYQSMVLPPLHHKSLHHSV